jgi:hypothetical protein
VTYYERLTLENTFRSPFVESLAYTESLTHGRTVLEVRRKQCGHCLGTVHLSESRFVWLSATRRTTFDDALATTDKHRDPYAARITPTEDARGVTLYAECRCKDGLWGIPGVWLGEQLRSTRRVAVPVAVLDTDHVPPAPRPLRFDEW